MSEMLREVIDGLSRPQKELSSKFFYDRRGSQLFEEITRLPEYYPTRTEAAMLRSRGAGWVRESRAHALIELGAGNAEKTRILLDALQPGDMYIPVDISKEFLESEAHELQKEYPHLTIRPAVRDITKSLTMPADVPAPAIFAFLGSTIGNFDRAAAIRLLRNIACEMRDGDMFLMGADLKKDPEVLHRAYNDSEGVTAEFNLNVLRVLNRDLGTDFDIGAFEHRAIYNEAAGRIEMHLVATSDQRVNVPGWKVLDIAAGETIRTEISTKYDESTIRELFEHAGLALDAWATDERNWYALTLSHAVRLSTSRLFPATPCASARIGAEIEMLVRERNGAIAMLDGSLGAWLESIAATQGWRSIPSDKGAPKYDADGICVTLEPGGQLEFSTPAYSRPRDLIDHIQQFAAMLADSAASHGLELHFVGIDPVHPLDQTALQLTAERYQQMDAYFGATSSGGGSQGSRDPQGSRGSHASPASLAGRRMMRQTAATQISVDPANDPVLTWDVLNRATPVLTALFANSRCYAGHDTGYASYRAATWGELDPTRTGAVADPAAYGVFARRARTISDSPLFRPFEEIPGTTPDEWETHLTTLFPDVRPRGFYEIRCIDAIPPQFIAAPVLIAAAIAFDETMLRACAALLPAVDPGRSARAAREGLGDPELAALANELVRLTVAACERGGERFGGPEDIEALLRWRDLSLAAGGAPLQDDFVGDDHVANHAITGLRK
jgi:L-histidine N-alpha-methyltransferase